MSQVPKSAFRKEMSSLGKNSLIYVAGQALSRAVGFFMIPVYTRYIAPAGYGAMEMIEILSSVVLLMISIGASDAMSRFYYAEKEPQLRGRVVSTVLIGFTAAALPVVLLSLVASAPLSRLVLDQGGYGYVLQVAFLTTWFGMICEVGFSYLRMTYRAKLFVLLTTLQLALALSLNIWFVTSLRLDILGIFYSTLISQAVVAAALSAGILRQVGRAFSFPLLREMIRFGLPLVPSRVGLMLGFVSNRFFLRWLGPADPALALAQIGLFSLGHKFAVVVNRFITAPINSFWAPRRMQLMVEGAEEADKTVARVCTYTTLLTVFAGLIISSAIASIVEIMATPSYRGAEAVVPFVVLSYIALGLEGHFSAGILYSKRTRVTGYITLLSLAVIVAWNCLFIPRFGLVGAATSNLAGFAVRLALTYHYSQKLHPIPFETGRLAAMGGAAAALYAASQWVNLPSPYLNFAARTAVVATFPVVLFAAGFFSSGERQIILDGLRKGGSMIKIAIANVRIVG